MQDLAARVSVLNILLVHDESPDEVSGRNFEKITYRSLFPYIKHIALADKLISRILNTPRCADNRIIYAVVTDSVTVIVQGRVSDLYKIILILNKWDSFRSQPADDSDSLLCYKGGPPEQVSTSTPIPTLKLGVLVVKVFYNSSPAFYFF